MTKKELETLVEQLEFRISMLESRVGAPHVPEPDVYDPFTNKCSICDIDFSDTMGYVCNNMACPMYPRIGDNFTPINTGG